MHVGAFRLFQTRAAEEQVVDEESAEALLMGCLLYTSRCV